MPPRLLAAAIPTTLHPESTVLSLDLLADYAHTLDSLPLDLSRIFADLRELDAVLTSTVTSLTSKIYQLIDLVENDSASNEQRLWLLGEIADEASKVRPGADDKIRIATTAADTLRTQSSYLTELVTNLPDFEPHLLVKRTTFPHVSAKAYAIPSNFESGRRRRAPNSAGAWLGVAEGSPNKKRRVLQEEDLDYNAGKSPAKQKSGDGGQRAPRGGQRPKKYVLPPVAFFHLHPLTNSQNRPTAFAIRFTPFCTIAHARPQRHRRSPATRRCWPTRRTSRRVFQTSPKQPQWRQRISSRHSSQSQGEWSRASAIIDAS